MRERVERRAQAQCGPGPVAASANRPGGHRGQPVPPLHSPVVHNVVGRPVAEAHGASRPNGALLCPRDAVPKLLSNPRREPRRVWVAFVLHELLDALVRKHPRVET